MCHKPIATVVISRLLNIKYLFLVFTLFSFYTGKSQITTQLDSINTIYKVTKTYHSGGRSLSSEDLLSINTNQFTDKGIDAPQNGVDYWSTFKIQLNYNDAINYIEFHFPLVDQLNIYIPTFDGNYKEYSIGWSIPRKKIIDIAETSKILIEAKNVDFRRPFFTQNKTITSFGLQSLKKEVYIIGYNQKPITSDPIYRKWELTKTTNNLWFTIFMGMLIISFVFMIIYYILHQKKYFLSYGLYLLSSILSYIARIPHFYNYYLDADYYFVFYANLNIQVFGLFSYMFFLKQFVGMKHNYPKLYPIYNKAIWGYILLIGVSNSILLISSYNPDFTRLFRFIVFLMASTMLISVCYMFVKRKLTYTTIVFVGYILLVIGAVLSTILHNNSIMLPLIVIETVLFMSVISYLDFKNLRKALEADKFKEINEFKSNFLSNISHEFRTPLTLITAPIQEKLEDPQLSALDRTNFEMIQRNSDRLLNLVDQILEVARTESGHPRLQVQLGNVMNLIRILTDSFVFKTKQKQIDYKTDIKKGKDVWYDPDIIEKIITNLLSNALKYTPEKGTISCNAHIEQDKLHFTIQNTGKGISNEQLEKMFERYYQADPGQMGYGIGLAFVKELVSLHKGVIAVQSIPNVHTIFEVSLPVNRIAFNDDEISINTSTESSVISTLSDVSVAGFSSETTLSENPNVALPILLIVEDNDDLRQSLKNTFQGQYKIIVANNGQKGVELALEHIPDLIISDVMMPIKDGIALAEELKNDERTSHIPIILLTAKVGDENELVGIETGADDYIVKPFKTRILTTKVENIIKLRQKLRDRYSQGSVFRPAEIATTPRDEQFLLKVEAILNEKLEDSSFTAAEFSQLLGMSRMQLHRKLVAMMGLSTTAFIRNERLQWAKLLLENSDLTISEIGYKVGFSTIPYFNSCFKEKYNCTPSSYRTK